jgi:hypothetical protein
MDPHRENSSWYTLEICAPFRYRGTTDTSPRATTSLSPRNTVRSERFNVLASVDAVGQHSPSRLAYSDRARITHFPKSLIERSGSIHAGNATNPDGTRGTSSSACCWS